VISPSDEMPKPSHFHPNRGQLRIPSITSEMVDDLTGARPEPLRECGTELSDRDLLTEVATGDQRALGELYLRHVRPVYGMVLRVLQDNQAAEEVVHDAFLRVWRRPNAFDPLRAQFRTWLLTIAHRLALDELRRRRARSGLVQRHVDAGMHAQPESDPTVAAEVDEIRSAVREALQALPGVQRAAIELAYFGGLSQSEIAEATGLPLGTIKSRIRFGMIALHDELEKRGYGGAWWDAHDG
jgi:RNA polymerase sigma-70 factor, ECF subfamily